jgi:glycosylphosphatidylinositol transamidase (GPIT) subunit GPI8
MYSILILAFFLINSAYSQGSDGVTWALLVAGSNEYFNYRHQVCFIYLFFILFF